MVNDIACVRLGYTRDELRLSPLDIVPPHNIAKITTPRTIHARGRATFDTVHRKKDGAETPWSMNAHLF